MYAQVEKSQENESRAVSNIVISKQRYTKQGVGRSKRLQMRGTFQNGEVPTGQEGISGVAQLCVKCKDESCNNGEKCKFDPTYGGLFHANDTGVYVGPHKCTKKHSKKQVFESEHVIAKKALDESGLPYVYDEEYTIQTPYKVHRGGQGGAGGGISSTGSSKTASEWAKHLGGLLKNDTKQAVFQAALEQVNAYTEQELLTNASLNAIYRWIESQATVGRIHDADKTEIQKAILEFGKGKLKA